MGVSTFTQPSFVSVATHAARNAIAVGLRTLGMLVYTQNDDFYWAWNGGTAGTDADWTQAGPLQVQLAGTSQSNRGAINFIQGSNVTLTVADNSGADRCDVTIAATGGGTPGGSSGQLQVNSSGSFGGVAISSVSPILMSQVLGTHGDAVITAGSTTYGTDRTAAIQSLWNAAAAAGQHIVGDGKYSHTGLTTPSGLHVEWLPGCGTILRAGSNAQLYQNATLSLGVGGTRTSTIGGDTPGTVGNITDTHIRIRGGIHNCNVQNQTATSSSSLLHGTRFWGVSDLYFEDMTIIDGGLWYANCEYFGARNITLINSQSVPPGSAGPQINGPARYFDFEDITCVNSSDDGFALNADDGNGSESFGFPYPFGGPITDGTLRGLRIVAGQQGLRFLSTSQRIDRIIVDDISGSMKYAWCLVSRFVDPTTRAEQTGTIGPGNIGSITISNVDMDTTAVQPFSGVELESADLFIDAQFESITVDGWKKNRPTAFQPSLYLAPVADAAAYGVLKVSNYAYLESNPAHSGPSFLLCGNLRSGQFSKPSVVRDAAASYGDSPLIRVDAAAPTIQPGTTATGPSTILIDKVYTDNCSSVVELAAGSVTTLLQIDGNHVNANGHAAVTVAAGTTINNLDTIGLRSMPVSGKKWGGAGAVTNDLDAAGTYAEPALIFRDALSGTVATVLTSHTPDLPSGATWPNDSNHQAGGTAGTTDIKLDGVGGMFLGGGDSANIPSVAMPSVPFEVTFGYERRSALAAGQVAAVTLFTKYIGGFGPAGGMLINAQEPGGANAGFWFGTGSTPAGAVAALPAVGTPILVRVRATASGSNTVFTAAWSAVAGISWTDMGIAVTVATSALTVPINVGPYLQNASGSGGWTSTTGPHVLGPLIIRAMG